MKTPTGEMAPLEHEYTGSLARGGLPPCPRWLTALPAAAYRLPFTILP
ncbi:MAG: hypothetical protein ACLUSP_01775 [Christensenellales bacterium]